MNPIFENALDGFFTSFISTRSKFNTHEFIISFAHAHQAEYVNELHVKTQTGSNVPFNLVHADIGRYLKKLAFNAQFVEPLDLDRSEKISEDIFGNLQQANCYQRSLSV